MVSLYYGNILRYDVAQPSRIGQDMFVLSKGHAVATLASIYSDCGYFEKKLLIHSRSLESVLNGHPGPLLPGVHVATGPMGQGIGVAQGFALAGRGHPNFDVYTLTGDGELQEGPVWETIMYAGYQRLENLCMMVDCNGGQLDQVDRLHFPFLDLKKSLESFGWRVMEVDATRYGSVYRALCAFREGTRTGQPTAILCRAYKGFGGFSDQTTRHKTSFSPEMLDQESRLQQSLRRKREESFCDFYNSLGTHSDRKEIKQIIGAFATQMGFGIAAGSAVECEITSQPRRVVTRKAPVRDKRVRYASNAMPVLEKGKTYAANEVITSVMRVLATDEKIVSVDADLSSTSGLQAGVGYVDRNRAFNVGVAEANMMLIGEAFAVLGSNVWISTFCPFFDWKVLRRIAVGYQERREVIAAKGWLSRGHGIDLTLLATAADLETQANGATHMGNDDALLMDAAAHIKIVNISCPRLLVSVMQWIAEGDKGILYLRVLRAGAPVVYPESTVFSYGSAYKLLERGNAIATIVTSGRGVFESLTAAEMLEKKGITVNVADMPSIDEAYIIELYREGLPVFIVEQNNGYLWSNFRKILFKHLKRIDLKRLIPINTAPESPHYIHSGTYGELAAHYGLDAPHLRDRILKALKIK